MSFSDFIFLILKSDSNFGVNFYALYLSNISCASITDTSGFFTLNVKQGRFKFSNRNLIQASVRSYNGESSLRFRNKSKIRFKLTKKIKPYLSYELFYRFDELNRVSNNRMVLGSNFSINKHWNVKLFYLLEKEIKSDHTEVEGVFGLKLLGKLKL